MKKLFLYLALATGLLAADAANDIVLSQRNSGNTGFVQRNVAPVASGFLTFDASKVPTSPAGLTWVTPTLSVPAAFNLSGAGALTLTAGGAAQSIGILPATTGGVGIGIAGSTASFLEIRQAGMSTPISSWNGAANPLLTSFAEGASGGKGDILIGFASSNAAARALMTFKKSNGTLAVPTAVAQNEVVGSILGSAYDGTNFIAGAAINVGVDNLLAVSTGIVGQKVGFLVDPAGGATRVEVAAIRSNGSLNLGRSNRTMAAWTLSGAHLNVSGATTTDSTSAGTVAAVAMSTFGTPTIAASSATTFTDFATVYIANAPTRGTNVTGGNPWAFWVDDGNVRFDGNINYNVGGVMVVSTDTLSGAGAVSVTKDTTKLTSSGVAQAITLANGTDGQIKRIIHDVDGGSMVLTPATKTGWSTATFTNVGESLTLEYVTTRGWIVVGSYLVVIAP